MNSRLFHIFLSSASIFVLHTFKIYYAHIIALGVAHSSHSLFSQSLGLLYSRHFFDCFTLVTSLNALLLSDVFVSGCFSSVGAIQKIPLGFSL